MLVLLPPSEGKRAPRSGAPVDLGALSLPELQPVRERVLDALEAVARGPRAAGLEALGLSAGQADELARDATLREAPAAAAARIYTGVLYQHLDVASLSRGAKVRARRRVLVASALWGVVALHDRIPAYRLSMGARLPGLGDAGGLAAAWRPGLAAALPDEPRSLVVDLRSGAYAAAWKPRQAARVEVKATTADGRPISHMAKAVRGRVARRLLEDSGDATKPEHVADVAGGERERVVLHEPAARGGPWVVEVIAAAPDG